MSEPDASRGRTWFTALTGMSGQLPRGPGTVLMADAPLGTQTARYLAIVPDAANRFPRARHGEVGLEEAWMLAQLVRDAMSADQGHSPRPIVAIVDAAGQAYGRSEELLGIHLACAAAVDAYASARLAGHPIVALLVGKALSGAFLAHGYQANRILALDSDGVLIHAMSKQAAARVTRRSVEELEQLGQRFVPMAYGVRAFAALGLLHRLIVGVNADEPNAADIERIRQQLLDAVSSASQGTRDLSSRLSNEAARGVRAASLEVRRRLGEQWDEP